METLVLALIAVSNLCRQQETLELEEKLRSLDLRELRHLYNADGKSPSRLSDWQASYMAQAAS